MARLAGVIFFCIFNRDYFMFGLFDLTFLRARSPFCSHLGDAREAKKERFEAWRAGRTIAEATPGNEHAARGHPANGRCVSSRSPSCWSAYRRGPDLLRILSALCRRLTSRPRKSTFSMAPSAPKPPRECRIGSGWCCRAFFPDKLPYAGGYESLGIVAQEGRELPIGFSKQTIGIERVGINCAFCHTATLSRACEATSLQLCLLAPSHTTSPQDYLRFLFACAADPRFNSSTIMAEIAKNYSLSLLDQAGLSIRADSVHQAHAACGNRTNISNTAG